MFAVFFWHSEGFTARNEFMMQGGVEQIAGERSPWLIACDAKMEPCQFCEGEWCGALKQNLLFRCRSQGVDPQEKCQASEV